jgi:hypothetical protein
MAHNEGNTKSDSRMTMRNVLFVLLASGLFLLKRPYSGPLKELIHSYAGNISVSFALYFLFLNLRALRQQRRLLAALLALACVESFEAFNGFGLMSNTYDPYDFTANAIGVACAFGLDTIMSRTRSRTASTNSVSS